MSDDCIFDMHVSSSDKRSAAKAEAARDARRNSAGKVFTKRDCKDTRAAEAVILSALKSSKLEATFYLLSSKPCVLMMKQHCKAYDEKLTVILDIYLDLNDCMNLFAMPGVFRAEVIAIRERYRDVPIQYDEFKSNYVKELRKRIARLKEISDTSPVSEMLDCIHKFRITTITMLSDLMILDFITKKHFQHWRSQDHSSCQAVAMQYYLYGDRSKHFANVRPEGAPPEHHHTVHESQNLVAHSTLCSMRTEDCYAMLKLDCHWLVTLLTGMERSPVSFSLHAAKYVIPGSSNAHTPVGCLGVSSTTSTCSSTDKTTTTSSSSSAATTKGSKQQQSKRSSRGGGGNTADPATTTPDDFNEADYPYVYANPAHERLLGCGRRPFPRALLLGRSIRDVIAAEPTEPKIERKFGKNSSLTGGGGGGIGLNMTMSHPLTVDVEAADGSYSPIGSPTGTQGPLGSSGAVAGISGAEYVPTNTSVLNWYPNVRDPDAEPASLMGVTVQSVIDAFGCNARNNTVHAYLHSPAPLGQSASEKKDAGSLPTVPVVMGVQPLFDKTGTKVVYYAVFHAEVPNDPFGATGAVTKLQVLLGQFPREIDTSNAGTSIRLPKNYQVPQKRILGSPGSNKSGNNSPGAKAVRSFKAMLGVTPAISPMTSTNYMSPGGSRPGSVSPKCMVHSEGEREGVEGEEQP